MTVLAVIKSAPTSATPNVLRWYNHIQSYKANERKKFAQKSLSSDVSKIISSGDKAAAPAEDDDDVDLFGSDEEEVPSYFILAMIYFCVFGEGLLLIV